jgi:hypothetical protein
MSEDVRNGPFEPQVKKERMSGLGMQYNRGDVIRKNKIFMIWPVKKKIELVLWVSGCDPFQCLTSEPSNTFQLVFYQ